MRAVTNKWNVEQNQKHDLLPSVFVCQFHFVFFPSYPLDNKHVIVAVGKEYQIGIKTCLLSKEIGRAHV